MKSIFMYFFVFIFTSIMSVSCSSMKKASPEENLAAKFMTPPENKSLVYIVRTSPVLGYNKMTVLCDGQKVGSMTTNRFIYFNASPGIHKLAASVLNYSDELILNLEAGKVYYVEYKTSILTMNKLVIIDDTRGKKKIKKCSLSRDNKPLLDITEPVSGNGEKIIQKTESPGDLSEQTIKSTAGKAVTPEKQTVETKEVSGEKSTGTVTPTTSTVKADKRVKRFYVKNSVGWHTNKDIDLKMRQITTSTLFGYSSTSSSAIKIDSQKAAWGFCLGYSITDNLSFETAISPKWENTIFDPPKGASGYFYRTPIMATVLYNIYSKKEVNKDTNKLGIIAVYIGGGYNYYYNVKLYRYGNYNGDIVRSTTTYNNTTGNHILLGLKAGVANTFDIYCELGNNINTYFKYNKSVENGYEVVPFSEWKKIKNNNLFFELGLRVYVF